MKRWIPSLVLALLGFPVTAGAGGVRVEARPGGAPLDLAAYGAERRAEFSAARVTGGLLSAPGAPATRFTSILALPYYAVDRGNAAGETALFAVRNATAMPVQIRVAYVSPDAADFFDETVSLAARETHTVNLRDVTAAPAVGVVVVGVVDPATGDPVEEFDLTGDYFRVEPAEAFAGGDTLLDVSLDRGLPDLCEAWDTRLFNGGPFAGGTDFTFFVPLNGTAPATPVAVGNIYDEEGDFFGTVELFTQDRAFELNSADIDAIVPLPTFGTLEWVLESAGHVSATFRASGLFSVRLPGFCADSRGAP